jgi:hypothetical protein
MMSTASYLLFATPLVLLAFAGGMTWGFFRWTRSVRHRIEKAEKSILAQPAAGHLAGHFEIATHRSASFANHP